MRQITGEEVMTFVYGSEGVMGFNLSGSTEETNGNYLYRKNLFGDITGIINESGALVYEYAYSAFGKSDKDEETGIGAKNPFRYRGYYYDEETGLYYLKTRYYDPETGRFITIGDISVLDTTKDYTNGLNLYAYCFNDPINACDDDGDMPKWLRWLLGIGIVLVVAAVAVLSAGIAAGGLAGAVIHGAAVGSLIGAGVGAVGGAIAGGIYSAVTGADFWTSVGIGIAAGFGIGAIVGALIGGVAGYIGYTPTKITGFTKHGINRAISRDGHGVADKALLDTVKNYKKIEPQGLFRSKFKFVGKNAVVILNKTGKVITAWAKNKAGRRFVLSLLWIGLGLQIEN